MLPTPSTSHVAFERIYEPAEDSYLVLDTLSSNNEEAFLHERFSGPDIPSPLVVEVGTGSGIILSFLDAHGETIFGRPDIMTLGIDVNRFACEATSQTIKVAESDKASKGISHGFYMGNVVGDLACSVKPREVDVLVFNPPYVPTSELPHLPRQEVVQKTSFEDDSHLLALTYAGGSDGMETTNRLLKNLSELLSERRGCAYILLCAQNKPERVKEGVRNWGAGWAVETVGSSGKIAGWEKLQIIRIWRIPVQKIR